MGNNPLQRLPVTVVERPPGPRTERATNSMTAPIRIAVEQHLPVSMRDGFDYITDPANWREYGSRLVRVEPPVESQAGPLGALDMREWTQTIATIDRRVEQTMRDGLFDLEHERRCVVTDEYDNGGELVAETSEWAGTRLDEAFAELVRSQPRPVRLHQQIRLRLLRAR